MLCDTRDAEEAALRAEHGDLLPQESIHIGRDQKQFHELHYVGHAQGRARGSNATHIETCLSHTQVLVETRYSLGCRSRR